MTLEEKIQKTPKSNDEITYIKVHKNIIIKDKKLRSKVQRLVFKTFLVIKTKHKRSK